MKHCSAHKIINGEHWTEPKPYSDSQKGNLEETESNPKPCPHFEHNEIKNEMLILGSKYNSAIKKQLVAVLNDPQNLFIE